MEKIHFHGRCVKRWKKIPVMKKKTKGERKSHTEKKKKCVAGTSITLQKKKEGKGGTGRDF